MREWESWWTKENFKRWLLKMTCCGFGHMGCMYLKVESRIFTHTYTLVCSTSHLCSEQISLQKCFASSLPPTAKRMEWLRNNYFLLSLISKKGIRMEAEGEAGNVGPESRAQRGTEANKSGFESVQTNQIVLWTIASWAHYQDGISLWRLPIKNKLEVLPTHCQWQNSKSATENYTNCFELETEILLWSLLNHQITS